MRFVALLAITGVIVAAFFIMRVPVHWQASYPDAPYESMVDCLEQKSAEVHKVGPRTHEHGQAAEVPLYERDTIHLLGRYEIEKSATGSTVKWRDVKGGLADDSDLDRLARERADTCAKSGKTSG